MSWRSFVLVGTAVLMVCAMVGLAQARVGLNDATDTCYIYKPDTTEGHYAITSFFVTYYDSTTGKPVSYFTPPELITPWDKAKFKGADDVAFRSAVDSQGNIHIVWMTKYWGTGEKWEIAYEKFDSLGTRVAGPIQVSDVGDSSSTPPQYNSAYPAIAIDSNDDAHIVWMDGRDGNWEIYYSKVSHTGFDLTVPDVCISDKDGWDSGRYIDPYSEWETVAGFQQGTGNPIVAVHTEFIEHPDICVDGGDTVHIVWSDYRNEEAGEHYWQVYWQSQTNDALPQVIINDRKVSEPMSGPFDCVSPAIAAGPRAPIAPYDFGIDFVWQETDYWGRWHVYYRKLHSSNGQEIIGKLHVSGGENYLNAACPDVAVDDGDSVYIVFMDDRDIDPGHHDSSHPAQNDIHIDGQWEIYVTAIDPAGVFFRYPKRESDLTTTSHTTEWGDPLFGEYTGPGSPANLHDCPSMYPQISAAGHGQSGWTNVTWQDYRNQNWDVYYTALSHPGDCPQADIRLTADPRPDKYPCISKGNTDKPDIAFQRRVDLGYGPEWEGYHCRWNGESEYVRTTVIDSLTGEQVGDYYLFQMDPTDTNAWDGVNYMWTMPLPTGTYRYQFRASIDAGATEVHTTPKYAAVPSLSNDKTGTPGQAPLAHPVQFTLEQNYPNPFNAATAIHYHLPVVSGQRSAVNLKIYNILGEEVRTLVDKPQKGGKYEVSWDGRDDRGKPVASGVYLARLEVKSDRLKMTRTRKMVLLR